MPPNPPKCHIQQKSIKNCNFQNKIKKPLELRLVEPSRPDTHGLLNEAANLVFSNVGFKPLDHCRSNITTLSPSRKPKLGDDLFKFACSSRRCEIDKCISQHLLRHVVHLPRRNVHEIVRICEAEFMNLCYDL